MDFIFWRLMKPLSKKFPEGEDELKKAYEKYMKTFEESKN